MFIRLKKVNGYEYAYLVRSVWDRKEKKVKQEVIKYLGNLRNPKRVHKLSLSGLSDMELDIIKKYMAGVKLRFPEEQTWKSLCPKCEKKKSRQAVLCRHCSTKKKFHGWVTPELVEQYT